MNYLLFDDRAAALAALQQMNAHGRQTQGPHFNWSDVLEHPVDLRFAVPYDERMSGALDLTKIKGELVDAGEATKRGFYFGPLDGRFYKALHKCQDAAILAENLAGAYGHTPFPVTRSLFLATLGSLYAAREHLKKVLQGPAAKALPHYDQIQKWWDARREEMGRPGEVLHFLHELNNSEKHGTPSVAVALQPQGRYHLGDKVMTYVGSQDHGNAMALRLGAEGAFSSAPFASGYEKWDILPDPSGPLRDFGITGAELTFAILGLPKTHLGQPLTVNDPVGVTRLAVSYYFDLVRGAIEVWPGPATG